MALLPPDSEFTANATIVPFAVKNKIYRKWHYYPPPSLRPIGGSSRPLPPRTPPLSRMNLLKDFRKAFNLS